MNSGDNGRRTAAGFAILFKAWLLAFLQRNPAPGSAHPLFLPAAFCHEFIPRTQAELEGQLAPFLFLPGH